ncbi:hypothetical protein [Dictyobacter arantiisoli]|uniref:Uncharacterized protein n=1 Tax=Dictyobacter arantiisoli TaxID=2014874 RepID=A0A5A5TDS4_9CHLR|nr:hypothetical protein [Dictyobacter arantiisoli]GCF09438.1 hypothetical protein KDI_30020 [Dictyobacter arantiisoli]
MDSVEFVDYVHPYIETAVGYFVDPMKLSGLYSARAIELFWNALYDEIGHFLVRTYDQLEAEELFVAGETLCWAFGCNDDNIIAGWSWMRGEEQSLQCEEGPIWRAFRNVGISIADVYDAGTFPKQYWVEIWYGPGSIKLLKHEQGRIQLILPTYIEARIELIQNTLNAYYAKSYQDIREIEAEDASGMVVKIRQHNLTVVEDAMQEPQPPVHAVYTCQIEQPRGLIQFSSARFPAKSLDELIVMLCYDFINFESFFTRQRFEELIGPLGHKRFIGVNTNTLKTIVHAAQGAVNEVRLDDATLQE